MTKYKLIFYLFVVFILGLNFGVGYWLGNLYRKSKENLIYRTHYKALEKVKKDLLDKQLRAEPSQKGAYNYLQAEVFGQQWELENWYEELNPNLGAGSTFYIQISSSSKSGKK